MENNRWNIDILMNQINDYLDHESRRNLVKSSKFFNENLGEESRDYARKIRENVDKIMAYIKRQAGKKFYFIIDPDEVIMVTYNNGKYSSSNYDLDSYDTIRNFVYRIYLKSLRTGEKLIKEYITESEIGDNDYPDAIEKILSF